MIGPCLSDVPYVAKRNYTRKINFDFFAYIGRRSTVVMGPNP